MGVLGKMGYDDTRNGMAYCSVLGDQCQGAMLDLLNQIGHTVRMVNIHIPAGLVYQGLISFQSKYIQALYQVEYHAIMSLGADVIVAGIEPSSDVQAHYMLAWFIRSVCCWTLCIEIEVFVIYRSLQCIVQMAGTVPDPVSFINMHMVHLDR